MLSTFANKRFISAFLKLTRTGNLAIIAFAQYFTAYFLIGKNTLKDPRLFLLTASTTAIAAAGYIINDYFDIKIDLINKPHRVVVGKSITRRFAIFFHITLSFIGILMGTYLSLLIGAINSFSVFLLWFYSSNFKRQPFIGNLTVAFLTGLSIYVVDILYPLRYPLISTYSLFAFFMTLAREVIKDMEDLKGDDTFGCRTLPIIWGLRRAKIFIYLIIGVFLIIAFLFNEFYAKLSIFYYIGFLFVPLLILSVGLARADMKKDFNRLSTLCKIIMLLGIISMAFL